MQKSNTYLKRGKGKHIANIAKRHFYPYYKANTQHSLIEKSLYDKFLGELLNTFATSIVEDNLPIKLGYLGEVRIRTRKLNFFNKEGKKNKSLRVDWPATWKHWEKQYEGLTRDEIVGLKGKKVIYFINEHSNQEFYSHLWDNYTAPLRYKRFYKFVPLRKYSRLLAKVVKDPNRKTYYYE